jgi:hypothetical protein
MRVLKHTIYFVFYYLLFIYNSKFFVVDLGSDLGNIKTEQPPWFCDTDDFFPTACLPLCVY